VRRRRRVFIEHIEVDALREIGPLLARFDLEPIIAMPPGRETEAWADALRRIGGESGALGLWPLLDDDDGYWLHTHNLDVARPRVDAVMAFARDQGLRVETICLDVEPPLPVSARLAEGPAAAGRALAEAMLARSTQDAPRVFRALISTLRAQGVEVYVTQLPTIAWGSAIGAMIGSLRGPANVEAIMLYSTMMERWFRSRRAARAFFATTARRHARQTNPLPALALGCVGVGKLGDEPVFDRAEELKRDVEVARAAGIDDLALFSLEGVIGRRDPEQWLRAFVG